MSRTEPHLPVILYCDIKAPTPHARVLTVEKQELIGNELRPLDTLVIPEDPEAVISPSKTDRFFLELQECSGYRFVNQEIISAHKEWVRIRSFLEGSPLLDIRKLTEIFFPTLCARELSDYKHAFLLEDGLTPPQVMARLAQITQARIAALPGRTIRLLKQLFRALPKQYGSWLESVPTAGAT